MKNTAVILESSFIVSSGLHDTKVMEFRTFCIE